MSPPVRATTNSAATRYLRPRSKGRYLAVVERHGCKTQGAGIFKGIVVALAFSTRMQTRLSAQRNLGEFLSDVCRSRATHMVC